MADLDSVLGVACDGQQRLGGHEGMVRAHLVHMHEAELIHGVDVSTLSERNAIIPTGITWAGYDFLDAARDATIWAKARDSVLRPAGGVAFSVLLEWLKEEAKRRLGMTP